MTTDKRQRSISPLASRKVVLRTDRLVLTSWLADDVDALAKIHSDKEVMRFVRNGRPETRLETAALIDKYISEEARFGVTKWRLADHAGEMVGRAGFAPDRDRHELGYTIRRRLWGQGLATEIAAALVAWHRIHAPDVPLWGYVAVGNPASSRVLEKSGLVTVGTDHHNGMACQLFRLPPTELEGDAPSTGPQSRTEGVMPQ